jgi:guanylate kinase
MNNRLTVIVGPTAVGKGTVVAYIKNHYPDIVVSTSATTRAPRPGEVDGVDYHFLGAGEFDDLIADNEMLEYATVHGGNKYGTPKKPVEQALALGKSVILEIDIQGARQIRQTMPEARVIFIAPPSWEELERRLADRGTETPEQQRQRLATARIELEAQAEFDWVVINDEVARCAAEVVDLIKS